MFMSPATLFARRYQPLDVLGQGGFGVVWRAFDQNLNREVALKLFIQGVPVFQAYYEAQLLTALESPHILRVFDATTYQDIPHITTAVAPLRSAENQMRVGATVELDRGGTMSLDSGARK